MKASKHLAGLVIDFILTTIILLLVFPGAAVGFVWGFISGSFVMGMNMHDKAMTKWFSWHNAEGGDHEKD